LKGRKEESESILTNLYEYYKRDEQRKREANEKDEQPKPKAKNRKNTKVVRSVKKFRVKSIYKCGCLYSLGGNCTGLGEGDP